LFNAGIRPAVNVGISVSRVGGSAQVKAMKKVAGTLKTDQAQFRELESFSKFGGDMDAVTKMAIDKGVRNTEMLKQPQYSPIPVEHQIAVIYCGTKGLLNSLPVEEVPNFEKAFIDLLEAAHKEDVLTPLKNGVINDDITAILENEAASVVSQIKEGLIIK
jgi:F-type H+-transporting ATPase subunit alpha